MIPNLHVNQVLVSGTIASRVHTYPGRAIFTLHNPAGRFYVQYAGKAEISLGRGCMVLIRGSLFSVPVGGSDAGRIDANEIILLQIENKETP